MAFFSKFVCLATASILSQMQSMEAIKLRTDKGSEDRSLNDGVIKSDRIEVGKTEGQVGDAQFNLNRDGNADGSADDWNLSVTLDGTEYNWNLDDPKVPKFARQIENSDAPGKYYQLVGSHGDSDRWVIMEKVVWEAKPGVNQSLLSSSGTKYELERSGGKLEITDMKVKADNPKDENSVAPEFWEWNKKDVNVKPQTLLMIVCAIVILLALIGCAVYKCKKMNRETGGEAAQ